MNLTDFVAPRIIKIPMVAVSLEHPVKFDKQITSESTPHCSKGRGKVEI